MFRKDTVYCWSACGIKGGLCFPREPRASKPPVEMSTNENSGGLNNVVNQSGVHPICPFLFSLNYIRLWGVIVHFSGQQNFYNFFLDNCEAAS